MPNRPTNKYKKLVSVGKLESDDHQLQILQIFDELYADILLYKKKRSGILRFFQNTKKIKGVYLWGSVGRGKTMLTDLFFAQLPLTKKRRVHFHEFMIDVHRRIHEYRQSDKPPANPVRQVADDISDDVRLFCLDEFQVHDVADAMILSALFEELMNRTVVVITSNRPPKDLYKGGLQRESFEKFIELVGERLNVVSLDAKEDYRLKQLKSLNEVFFTPANAATEEKLERIFDDLTSAKDACDNNVIEANGIKIVADKICGDVAKFQFDELCAKALGAKEYLYIASTFQTIIISNIPKLKAEDRNEAKRFVTLIDAIYEAKANLICSSAVPRDKIYEHGDGTFEFERTVSRLIEMGSENYLAAEHICKTS